MTPEVHVKPPTNVERNEFRDFMGFRVEKERLRKKVSQTRTDVKVKGVKTSEGRMGNRYRRRLSEKVERVE